MDDGPHLFNLPDGFLSAVSRSFRRHVDIVANKVDLSEADVLHVANLTKVLIVLARNVDNLSQLASSSSVNDCVAIAGSVLRKDFVSQARTFPLSASQSFNLWTYIQISFVFF